MKVSNESSTIEMKKCERCSTEVRGKYCPNCGKRIFNEVERYRKKEREVRKNFGRAFNYPWLPLANGVIWFCIEKCCKFNVIPEAITGTGAAKLNPAAYERLEKAENRARELMIRIQRWDEELKEVEKKADGQAEG